MVFVLLLMVVLGMLTAGWISLMSARSGMVQQMEAAIQRRVAFENSKALAQQFILERVMVSSSGASFTYEFPQAGWGGINVPAWNSPSLTSFDKAAGFNHFNPGNGDGYTNAPLLVTLFDGDANPERKYHVKSRSPALSGTLLTSQKPTLAPAASIALNGMTIVGHSMVWTPNLSMPFRTSSYALAPGSGLYSFVNSSGNPIAPLNFATPREIANPRTGSGPFYTGEFDVINNAHGAANSLAAKAMADGMVVDGSVASSTNGVVCDGSGAVTINLATQGLGNVYIPGKISSLTLEGQNPPNDVAANDLPAMLIVVDQTASSTRDLMSLSLTKHNHRRVVLAIKKSTSASSLPIQFSTASPQWRLLLELENVPITFSSTGIITLQGGIRSDRSVTASSGSAVLKLETDPKYLERLASRSAWVESFTP